MLPSTDRYASPYWGGAGDRGWGICQHSTWVYAPGCPRVAW